MRTPRPRHARCHGTAGTIEPVLVLVAALAATPGAAAGEGDAATAVVPEPSATGWSLYLDNDALTLLGRDQQYTGGFALTLSGRRAVEYPWSLDPVRAVLDDWSGFGDLHGRGRRVTRHSFELGLTAFTPDAIETTEPIADDHPYAGLLFVSNTRQTVDLDRQVSYQSVFALGVLGTDIPRAAQDGIHGVIGSEKPRGWDNQISDGGEPTANYVVNRQEPIWLDDDRRGRDLDVRSTIGASVGYTTQVMAGINWRWGHIRTPWWGFNPDFAEYINLGTPVAQPSNPGGGVVRELYLWGSLQYRLRLYNALLEGQFRDSAVTFDRDELDSTLAQATLGVTCGFLGGTQASLALRYREPELEGAEGLDPVWGSLIVSRAF
jgi:hypothetical protein